ncbi:hypothetical protein [Klebsiella oxytoca]|uniref:hypothetical protein n=1 Tax=Klebsiella oxytoca TaxID=571 RepID=UPI002FF1B720
MTDITVLAQRMKATAEKLDADQWQTRNGFSGTEVIVKGSLEKRHGCVSFQPVAADMVDTKTARAIALFSPANVLALVEALEKVQKSNEFLKGQLSEIANFNPDWDKLEASYDSWREIAAELLVAKERIAELESEVEKWKQESEAWEQVAETHLAKAIELESRTVTVKPMRPGHITVGGEKLGIYMRDEVDEFLAALTAAGIKVEAE